MKRAHVYYPGFRRDHALIDAKALCEWLTGLLADMPESVRKTATYDSFQGVLSYEVE